MDPGVEFHHSRCLAGIPPSMSPPPSWKRTKQSGRTQTHFDSHTDLTMNHTSDILEAPPSLPPRAENAPDSVYGTPKGADHFEIGTSYTVR